MTTISIRSKTFQVATTWNELSQDQLLRICSIIYASMPLHLAKLLMIKQMAQVPTIFWNSLTGDDVSEFLYLADDMLKTRLTKQLVPLHTVNTWWKPKTFAGPADNFNNLKMAEFVFTENYFFKYKEDETNTAALDQLVAVLYRPIKPRYDITINPDGDTRQEFNENRCAHNAAHYIRKWDHRLKLAALTYYEHCRLQLIDDFPAVFSGGSGEPAKYGLITMMRNVAQGGNHGNFERVENMYLKLVMIELDEMLMEAEQIEKLNTKK
jgi:hypothetical protein